MGLKRVFAPVMGVFLLVLTQHTLGEDPFHLTYRLQNLSSDGLTQSGVLLLTVVNVSGKAVKEVMASVPGRNNVTYDNRTIVVGDLAEGAQTEVLDEFHVPQELADPGAMEDNVTWQVEYTNNAGDQLSVEVDGERVPE